MAVMALATVGFSGCGIRDEALVVFSGESSEESAEVLTELEALERAELAADTAGTVPEAVEPLKIYVYVCGAVLESGVVELSEGSRAEEALRLAGGMTEDADPCYVNLAETVTDGQKLYFPTREEAVSLEAEAQAKADGMVNINTASVEELCTLPGIGASRAADIVRYREQNGGFVDKEDIMKVSGIKQNAYGKICDRITVQ